MGHPGSPYTLAQAQAHLKASVVGNRITFCRADPLAFLAQADQVYDVAVLAHCIWYFASPSVLLTTLRALSSRTKRICLAEYALTASDPSMFPHVLAALTQASLECRKPDSEANIRTVVSPARIKEIAAEAELVLLGEYVLKPLAKMYDGRWEVGMVLGKGFKQELALVKDERDRAVIEALRDATLASRESLTLAGVNVTTMDVWSGVFTEL